MRDDVPKNEGENERIRYGCGDTYWRMLIELPDQGSILAAVLHLKPVAYL